ncbi:MULTISPECIES: hypothetical protein [unclassified Coleofasciculus]|uniref:hypothetical protein n=1 Tax=unclassified Coleofasciculus TaxID=2692782 RepID=UPI0018813A9E|nr:MULTISPECIES: hypothetical protein [unclassified Coleofasciculus]MBE9128957.1 hypothetical protein [Coleofasciculus sp. LEGE 07081]MBE9148278.1 hypothetical protein [Coleofasciculus sp. LEGE 07092]
MLTPSASAGKLRQLYFITSGTAVRSDRLDYDVRCKENEKRDRYAHILHHCQ